MDDIKQCFEWNYDTQEITEYERTGVCNGCGDCCLAMIRFTVAGVKPSGNGHNVSESTDCAGVWAETRDSKDARYFVKIKSTEIGTEHRCPDLTGELRCGLQNTKSTICETWPFHPSHTKPFARCSYSFREVAAGVSPMLDRGVCIIAYGDKAKQEAAACAQTVRERAGLPALPVIVKSGDTLGAVDFTDAQQARLAKTRIPNWTPFADTLYLDADCRVFGDVSIGFELLNSGYDIVITPSTQQDDELLWHVGEAERRETFEQYGCADILQLQGGVFWFRANDATRAFFDAWHEEWMRYCGEDQAALLRAMKRAPVKVHLLGRDFNGGAIVSHRFGAIRER